MAPAGVEPIIDLGELRCDAAPNLSLALPLPEALSRTPFLALLPASSEQSAGGAQIEHLLERSEGSEGEPSFHGSLDSSTRLGSFPGSAKGGSPLKGRSKPFARSPRALAAEDALRPTSAQKPVLAQLRLPTRGRDTDHDNGMRI